MRCPPSLAAVNRRATSADRFSESPNCMAGGMGRNWRTTEVEGGGYAGSSDKEGGDGWRDGDYEEHTHRV